MPPGQSCTLDGTVVDGNVLVGPTARLTMTQARIEGNVHDDNGSAGRVVITDSHIGGNVQLEQGSSAELTGNRIDGDVQWESNSGTFLADDNVIDGNLQANQNTGAVTITDNLIDGNLQCQANNPAPTGGDNVVEGDSEGRCADLRRDPGGGGGGNGGGGDDGGGTSGQPLPPGGRRCFTVAGSPGDAAIVNLTPVEATGFGNGQLLSSDVTAPPVASNVNYRPGSIDPNVAIDPIGTDGQVCYLNATLATVHLVADHLGTIAEPAYTPASTTGAPVRTVDTRTG